MKTLLARLFLACAGVVAGVAAAWGCSVPLPHSTKFPVCSVPFARPDEDVVAIRVDSGRVITSFVLPSSEQVKTGVVDVNVGAANKPLYIVISSRESVIWRFKGNVEAVSRVVAFGSEYYGPKHVALTGISRDKVVFPETSDRAYLTQRDGVSTCGYEARACHPAHYFFRYPDHVAPGRAVLRQVRLWDYFNAPSGTFTANEEGIIPTAYFDLPKLLSLEGAVWGVDVPALTESARRSSQIM